MFEKIKNILYRSILSEDIDYTEAKKILNSSSNSILLDVRSPQEYEEGHLPQAQNISVYELEKVAPYAIPDKYTNIIVYCATGARSQEAKKILEELEYKNVYNLAGGINKIF